MGKSKKYPMNFMNQELIKQFEEGNKMAHPDMKTFSIEIPINDEKAMDEFQHVMDELHDSHVEYVKKIAQEMNISESCANDVVYLRTRSRWTPELELKLIQLHKNGTPPNVNEFGC